MSASEQLRRRLEAINHRPLAGTHAGEKRSVLDELRRRIAEIERTAAPPPPHHRPIDRYIVLRRDLRPRDPEPVRRARAGAEFVKLESAVEGREVQAPDGSRVYLVEQPVERRIGDSAEHDLERAIAAALERPDSDLRPHLERARAQSPLRPEDLVFLDLETTGLSPCAPLFLIGIMVWDDGRLITRQYFARDYSEERAALLHFLRQIEGRKLLVSYNGKSFDAPFVRMRSAAHRVPAPPDLPHLDLLHSARRTWRWRLPNCKLQTVERWICGRSREDDIPGAEIPDAYHAYVRTGNAAEMIGVLEHNRLDLVTLGEICVRLPAPGTGLDS